MEFFIAICFVIGCGVAIAAEVRITRLNKDVALLMEHSVNHHEHIAEMARVSRVGDDEATGQ